MLLRVIIITVSLSCMSGCVGKVIDTAGDATVAVVKIPFKVAGAVVDGVTGKDKKEKKNE